MGVYYNYPALAAPVPHISHYADRLFESKVNFNTIDKYARTYPARVHQQPGHQP